MLRPVGWRSESTGHVTPCSVRMLSSSRLAYACSVAAGLGCFPMFLHMHSLWWWWSSNLCDASVCRCLCGGQTRGRVNMKLPNSAHLPNIFSINSRLKQTRVLTFGSRAGTRDPLSMTDFFFFPPFWVGGKLMVSMLPVLDHDTPLWKILFLCEKGIR